MAGSLISRTQSQGPKQGLKTISRLLDLLPGTPGASARKELRGDRQVVRAAVAQDGAALEYASEEMPGGPSLSGGHGAPGRPHSGASARGEELRSDHELVLAAVAQNGLALQYASKELRKDRAFVLKAVEKTRAWFLVNWAGPELRVDKDFQRRCVDTCSTGLVFTYYESYTAFTNMRSSFLATGASVPGGQAYERVMEQLRNRGDEGSRAAIALRGADGIFLSGR
ncbi:unnamed protein product [Effrenium voratum]|uniref:DUF4116 domain-containing protein n=1 Tax=Effrenium voratum TaxID=2562239 RepID=A0AA36N8B9_9DINO|nr:unnamed protein product [Effrenium voratum]